MEKSIDDKIINTPYGKKRWGFVRKCFNNSVDIPLKLLKLKEMMDKKSDYDFACSGLDDELALLKEIIEDFE